MDYKHTPEVATELYQKMCQYFCIEQHYLELRQIECDQESVTMQISSGIIPSLGGRFLKFWANVFEELGINTEIKKQQLTIHAPYDNVIEIVNSKLAEQREEQIKNDEEMAALEQWKELHNNDKRMAFLSDTEKKELKGDLENEMLRFKF